MRTRELIPFFLTQESTKSNLPLKSNASSQSLCLKCQQYCQQGITKTSSQQMCYLLLDTPNIHLTYLFTIGFYIPTTAVKDIQCLQ